MLHRNRARLIAAVLVCAGVAFPLGVLASHQFTDVLTSNPFHNDIDALVDSGVTSGCGNNQYCPKANVTREQMAAFLNRLGALGPGKTPVVNADKVDGFDSQELRPMRLGAVETTALVGGNPGGATYTLTCPAGSIATGLMGDWTFVDPPHLGRVSVTCTPVTLGTGFVMALGTPAQTGMSGDRAGSAPYSIQCASGSVMVGVSGSTTPIFDGTSTALYSLSIDCTPLGGAGKTTVVGFPNPEGATPFALSCAPTKVVTGLGPAYGDPVLFSIRVRCQ